MTDPKVVFTGHAIRRMFEWRVDPREAERISLDGLTIERYPDDKPLPSRLVLGWIGTSPLHIVVASDDVHVFVVTVYKPDPKRWDATFQQRLQQ